jgi:hypothetical protein
VIAHGGRAAVGMGTGGGECSPKDHFSAATGDGVSVIYRLMPTPGDGHAIWSRGQQYAVTGPFEDRALSESPGLCIGLGGTPHEFGLLVAGRTGSGHPPAVGVCGWCTKDLCRQSCTGHDRS